MHSLLGPQYATIFNWCKQGHSGNKRKLDVTLQVLHRNSIGEAGIKSNYLGLHSVSLVIRTFHVFPAISCHIYTLLKYYKQHPHRIWAFWRLMSYSRVEWGRDLAANLACDPIIRDSTRRRMGPFLLANNLLSFGYSRTTCKIKSSFQNTSSCKAWSKFRQQAQYFPSIQLFKVRLPIQFPFLATVSTHPFHRQAQ